MKNVSLFFNSNKCDDGDPAEVGNKAANLMSMMKSGISIPEGFVLPSHLTFGGPYSSDSDVMVRAKAVVRFAADHADRDWSNESDAPYLVSVRSGAAVSMPGMMDTILNVGLNNRNVKTLAKMLGDTDESHRFAFDCYRRLIQMYATTVCGHDPAIYSKINDMAKEYFLVDDAEMMRVVADNSFTKFAQVEGEEFPQNIDDQLCNAISAVFSSWHSERAVAYRDHMNISHDLGTAVTIQGMRFGNFNERSGTGVVFSRDPNTGEDKLYGDFLLCAQGEDVVAGKHNAISMGTPEFGKISEEPHFIKPFYELFEHVATLDSQFGCAVDIEYTIEDGKLWVLQCRTAKLGAKARALEVLTRHMSSSFASEVLAELEEILGSQGTSNVVSKTAKVISTGQGVSSGIASGIICRTKEDVDAAKAKGTPYIFVATDTDPNDTPQMLGAAGIVTTNGSSTCHAAVVARSWDIPAVVGCTQMCLLVGSGVVFESADLHTGDSITINGDTGEIFLD